MWRRALASLCLSLSRSLCGAPMCTLPALQAGVAIHPYPSTSPEFTYCRVGARLAIGQSCELDCLAGFGAAAADPQVRARGCVALPLISSYKT
jgi:hypothetical protein